MKTIALLIVFFLAIAVFARSYDRRTRTILSLGIIVALVYLYIA